MSTATQEAKRYRLSIPVTVETALKHAAVERRCTVATVLVEAAELLVRQEGWLDKQPQEASVGTP